MDVINKFYSSVSSTVSQLSGVLPGNPVTREYEIISHIASAGPGLLWKIYSGYKKSTKQEAAIFVFEKRYLERWSRGDKDLVLDSLRRGVTQLTKLRHPQILTVQHPLEESRESLAFATEPVFSSLANALGQSDNMPHPMPIEMSDYKFFEVEIKYGLLQIGEGLAFLHNDVKLLHKNIAPESIIINKQGAWKIFGFDFCVHNEAQPNSQPFWPFVEYTSLVPSVAQPALNFMAPEIVLTQSHSAASDIYSLGMLAYTLQTPVHLPMMPCNDYQGFKQRAQQLKQLPSAKLQCVAEGLKEYVKMMLNITPELRPDAHQFIKIPFFDDVGVKTLNYLDSLFQWDNVQKSQFYKGLPDALHKLPPRVRLLRVLPCLVRDLIQPIMVPFVLPSVLNIAENCTKEQYNKFIFPHLKPVMKIQDPIQILIIFVQKMELLLKLTSPEDITQEILPMLYRGLDNDAQQIHELCLAVLPTFAGLLDHAAVKNSVLPRVKRLCLSTQSLSVRVNCLLCLGRLLEHLDKWLVLDEVLPFLPQIPSREPAVLMGILGIYKMALDHKKLGITKEVIATRILPFLMPLCIENGLTMNQFNALVALVKQMFNTVETEHRNKLQQLNSVQHERKQLDMSLAASTQTPVKTNDAKLDSMFSGLGLDQYLSNTEITPNTSSSESVKEIGSLSLQDKQRLAQQQEASKLFHSQPVLSPLPNTNVKSSPSSKDLSSTLPQWSSSTPSGPQTPWVMSQPTNIKPTIQANIATMQNNMSTIKPNLPTIQSNILTTMQTTSLSTMQHNNLSNIQPNMMTNTLPDMLPNTSRNMLSITSNMLANTSNMLANTSNMLQNTSNMLPNTSTNMLPNPSTNILSSTSNMLSNTSNMLQNTSNMLPNTSNMLQNSSTNMLPNTSTNMAYNQFPTQWQANPWSSTKSFTSPTQNGGNWSALDTLLPNVQQTKTSMNQMLPQKQPLLTQNPSSESNKPNVLSKDDILDLLS